MKQTKDAVLFYYTTWIMITVFLAISSFAYPPNNYLQKSVGHDYHQIVGP